MVGNLSYHYKTKAKNRKESALFRAENRIMNKKNMKLRSFAVAMALAVCMMNGGCKEEPERTIVIGESNSPSDSAPEKEASDKSFAFVHNNVKITPNDLVDPLITALGSDYSYHESPSCAYIGLDKCYVYKGFSIYTYPDENAVDHVLQIVLTDDSLSTPEGLIIGDTAEKVIELYGNDYAESDGSYAYTLGKTTLTIIVKNDKVVSIQYYYTDSY